MGRVDHSEQFPVPEDVWNERLCRRLLGLLLGNAVSRIDLPQTEEALVTDFRAKSVRLDVCVEDDGCRVFDIETQATDRLGDNLRLRMRYYQAMVEVPRISTLTCLNRC